MTTSVRGATLAGWTLTADGCGREASSRRRPCGDAGRGRFVLRRLVGAKGFDPADATVRIALPRPVLNAVGCLSRPPQPLASTRP